MTTGHDGATSVLAAARITGYDRVVEIGRGGFAVVYRARRVAFAQDVAIKVLTLDGVDPFARARFERERQVLGALAQHPNIVTLYDSGTTVDGSPFLVMEYLPGGTLSAQLRERGPLDVRRVVDVAVKLCGALETAHRTGVLHRDIKPDNILVSRYGEPVLADFGIARMSGAMRTESGVVNATLSHAPPEVLEGHPPSPRSDLYSLASTLYALLAGSAPFVRDTDKSMTPLIGRVLSDPVPDLRPRGVPADVCALLERALAKDPAARPGSALELGQEFQRLQRVNGVPVAPMVVEQLDGDTAVPDVEWGGTRPRPAPAPPVVPSARRPPLPASPAPVAPPVVPRPEVRPEPRPPRAAPEPHRVAGGSAVPPAPRSTGPSPAGGPPPDREHPVRRRRPWLLPAIGIALVAAVVAVIALVRGLSGGEPPAGQLAPTTDPGGRQTVTAVPDLGPLLLETGDVGPGATELDAPPFGELSSVLWCDRAVPQDGKTAEAERSFAAGGDGDYQVDAHVAAFAPGAAGPFMDRLAATAERCATTGRPAAYEPPPGADRALRLTTGKRDAIWLSAGDHVVKVDVAFGAGGDVEVDPATAPDLAARAVARTRPGG